MKGVATVDLDAVVDGQRIGPPIVVLVVIATLVLVSDGFDLAAIGYVGPELVKSWHVAAARLVPVFSAGIVGLFVGAPVLGFVGDRHGRKIAIVAGLAIVGGFTLSSMAATSLHQLLVLRFLTGVGLGGVIPNAIALVAELSPTRLRGRLLVLTNLGVAAGIAIPGLVAAAWVPRFGWPVLFLVGGLLPLVVAVIAMVRLPESIKYLAERGDRVDEVRRLAQRMRPDLAIDAATRFVATYPAAATVRGSPKRLFLGQLAVATPLIWVFTAANQMSNFFSLTWLPTLLQASGASTAQAGVNGSLFSLGGLVGGICLMTVIDRLGVVPLVFLFALGAPLIAGIGIAGLSPVEHGLVIAGAGLCVTGINFGTSALLGIVYPTPVRSVGTGWAHAAGRLGALAAPLVGGLLLSLNLSVQQLLLAPAAVLVIGAIACAGFATLCFRRFGGPRLGEFAEGTIALDRAVKA